MSENCQETQNREERAPDHYRRAKIRAKMHPTPKNSNSKNQEIQPKVGKHSRRMPNLARHLLDQRRQTLK